MQIIHDSDTEKLVSRRSRADGASTILTTNDEGQIAHVVIWHRPLHALLAFSNELGNRMEGRIDRDWFYRA
jgi:hypothetical protein